MKITETRARVLRVPVQYPLLDRPSEVGVVLFEIHTDSGQHGHALAAYPMSTALRTFLTDDVGPFLAGCDPIRTELVRQEMATRLTNRTLGGTWACAASLVDIALWDVIGQALGEPVWRLLGGAREIASTPTSRSAFRGIRGPS